MKHHPSRTLSWAMLALVVLVLVPDTDAAGVAIPESMQGKSFLRLPIDPDLPWRTAFLYTYFWEAVFPETPTCFGVRTDQYKYVEYHGIWDTNELYDLKADPNELHNRISTSHRKKVTPDPEFAEVYQDLRKQLGRLKAEVGIRAEPEWGQ